ncbi:MAG: hypothetical protein GTO17_03205 [Candidatus Aminicenantes bacterium]|nr:hypothetical protein [Candidatus Aminicenantes bacterium]
MTKRDIVSISLKILGVFSVIYAVRQISRIAYAISIVIAQSERGLSSVGFLFGTIPSIILPLVVAYILLRWGDLIAKRLEREDSKIPTLGENGWEKPVFILSLRIVGVVCLIRSIPDLFNLLIRFASEGGIYISISPEIWGGLFSSIVLLIIGLYLISGGKRFVKFVLKEAKIT